MILAKWTIGLGGQRNYSGKTKHETRWKVLSKYFDTLSPKAQAHADILLDDVEEVTHKYEELQAYQSTGLTPEGIKGLQRFKAYWGSFYGQGLEVANWHLNGTLEPFDSFFDSAIEEEEKELEE